MLKRIALEILLAIQLLGGGAVTLAHARDVVAAPRGVEASHTARCAILHDEMRCALCQYANARVVTQQVFTIQTPVAAVRYTHAQPVVSVRSIAKLTAPARAPPTLFS
ncbi:MAG TPA: hypothetical protein VGU74_14645 [Gemmatimonadales bacterium]|nr:hypothetical protein [Gemmatimonadales bacterium]